MRPPLLSDEDRRSTYWSPCHPRNRWVIAVLGIAGVGFGIWDLIQSQGLSRGFLAPGLIFLSSSLQKPQLKPKNWGTKISGIIMAVLIVAVIVL